MIHVTAGLRRTGRAILSSTYLKLWQKNLATERYSFGNEFGGAPAEQRTNSKTAICARTVQSTWSPRKSRHASNAPS
jgi:hypothetical protein